LAIQQVLSETTFTMANLQRIVARYLDTAFIAHQQDTRKLNSELRALNIDVGKPQRAELVICQIILVTWSESPELPSVADLCRTYGLQEEEVVADQTLAEFVWFMKQALVLVAPRKHMEFLISDVVAPLSEKLSGKRYPAGSGTESIGTMMRYAVFETETGYRRPKSRRLSDPGPPTGTEESSSKKQRGQSLVGNAHSADTLSEASESLLPELTEQEVLDLIMFERMSEHRQV
jgi:hypothetical protein